MTTSTQFFPLIALDRNHDGAADTSSFAQDVVEGLSQPQKSLSSRYFYDSAGSKLFQQIMDLPEYYLTRCEYEILENQKETITSHFNQNSFFHLIDLGAGDALKTKILLRQLLESRQAFDYVPVDISEDAMLELTGSLQEEMPQLSVQAVAGEYLQALEWLQQNKTEPKVVLFLGSNIGNFTPHQSIDFLRKIRSYLQPGDKLLLGIDQQKDPATILRAYDDAAGVTANFNLNLLRRINRELGGHFDLSKFRHFATYKPQEGVMNSFLVSQEEQEVYIAGVDKTFHFSAWEAIFMENSYKYNLQQVTTLGTSCGFRTEAIFQDTRHYFADVLFAVD